LEKLHCSFTIMFFLIAFALSAISDNLITGDCLDLLTYEEKPCTTMRTGMVRHINDGQLEICTNKMWQPYFPRGNINNRISGLIGHWKMDEQDGNSVADDSGYENHGLASGGPIPKLSKFSYGRYFNSNGWITIPNAAALNFGVSSFTVSGWQKILDLEYPLTSFAVKKGNGCYFRQDQEGWLPGWETAHGHNSNTLNLCIRDNNNVKARKSLVLDDGYQPGQLIGQWVHYAIVFDRELKKRAFVYVNGKKQSNSLDISTVTGSVDNNKDLTFGQLYGWKTKGTLDEYRIYNHALDVHEVHSIFNNHLA